MIVASRSTSTGPTFGLSSSLRFGIVACFGLAAVAYAVLSWRWPLIWDMQVLHYVSFLMDRGWAPYRQIADMNMPGAYLIEHTALHVFGDSDVGWRMWDFTLCAVATGSTLSIARRYDWLAGVLGGGLFTLMHGAEGPMNAGQRDQVMAVLLLLATAFLFEAVRRDKAWLSFGFAVCATLAATVKPTVGLFCPVALALACVHLRRAGRSWIVPLLWAAGGVATTLAIVVGYLVHWGSLAAFARLVFHALPHYAGLNQETWGRLLVTTLQPSFFLYVGAAVFVRLWAGRRLWDWEEAVLLTGVVVGMLNFYMQRKGFPQHRYTMTAFLSLWASIQLVLGLRGPVAVRRVATVTVLVAVLLYIPRDLYWIHKWPKEDLYSAYLENDLRRLGTVRLQRKVQCLELIDGCLNALFHVQVEQSTGATGDMSLFLRNEAPVVHDARAGFLAAVEARPPDVYVVGNFPFETPKPTFAKLDTWPAFKSLLGTQYVMVLQREFPKGAAPTSTPNSNPEVPAYRIYVRKGSDLPPLSVAGL